MIYNIHEGPKGSSMNWLGAENWVSEFTKERRQAWLAWQKKMAFKSLTSLEQHRSSLRWSWALVLGPAALWRQHWLQDVDYQPKATHSTMLSRKPFPFTMEDFFLEGKRKKKSYNSFLHFKNEKKPKCQDEEDNRNLWVGSEREGSGWRWQRHQALPHCLETFAWAVVGGSSQRWTSPQVHTSLSPCLPAFHSQLFNENNIN